MARRRHTPEQIVRKLREADRLLGEGAEIADVARRLEVSEATFHRWRNQYVEFPPYLWRGCFWGSGVWACSYSMGGDHSDCGVEPLVVVPGVDP